MWRCLTEETGRLALAPAGGMDHGGQERDLGRSERRAERSWNTTDVSPAVNALKLVDGPSSWFVIRPGTRNVGVWGAVTEGADAPASRPHAAVAASER